MIDTLVTTARKLPFWILLIQSDVCVGLLDFVIEDLAEDLSDAIWIRYMDSKLQQECDHFTHVV